MALRFMDSFDALANNTQALQRWTVIGGNSPQYNNGGGYGRLGTQGFRCGDNAAYIQKNLDSQGTWIVGTAFKPVNPGVDTHIITLSDFGTYQGAVCVQGQKLTYRNSQYNGTLLGTGTTTLATGVYYYVEVKVTISNTVGTLEVRLNGVTEIGPLTNQDTQNTANASANGIILGEAGIAFYSFAQYDDCYMCDGTGPAPYNDFLGDCRVQAIMPSGNGNSSQWLGSDADSVNNYLLVDDTPNDDTDYVESGTVGEKDTYAYGDLASVSGSVLAVQIDPWARKTDAGTRKIATVARVAGVEEDSAEIALGTSYAGYVDLRTTKPGGGAWTIADVNAAEFGVKVTS